MVNGDTIRGKAPLKIGQTWASGKDVSFWACPLIVRKDHWVIAMSGSLKVGEMSSSTSA